MHNISECCAVLRSYEHRADAVRYGQTGAKDAGLQAFEQPRRGSQDMGGPATTAAAAAATPTATQSLLLLLQCNRPCTTTPLVFPVFANY